MSETITYSGQLTVVTCWCGIEHAVPENLHRAHLQSRDTGRDPQHIYCPLGHKWIAAGESEADRLKSELARANQRLDQANAAIRDEREQKHAVQRRLSAQQGVTKRMRNRVQKGVCPCCNRHFVNLQRHMQTKHPEAKEQG